MMKKSPAVVAEGVRILLADDHPIFRHGLRQIISRKSGWNVIGESCDGEAAMRDVLELAPDILVLDLDMPMMSGLQIAAELQKQKLPVRVIILTALKDKEVFNQALDLGVKGYILKESALSDILVSIQCVMDDEFFLSPGLSDFMEQRRQMGSHRRVKPPNVDDLTRSEKRILTHVADNMTSKEIASHLGLSVRTVENHRANICNKLGLHGIHSLVKFALENRARLGVQIGPLPVAQQAK